jgi:uncharacterized protein
MTLPAPMPLVTGETREFWAAAAEGTLLLRWCRRCDAAVWYPRTICPVCHEADTYWRQASGTGTVYSYTVVRRAAGAYKDAAPFVLAYVELAEGPRIMTNLVGISPDSVRIGQAVHAVFDTAGPDAALVRFAPSPETEAEKTEADNEG